MRGGVRGWEFISGALILLRYGRYCDGPAAWDQARPGVAVAPTTGIWGEGSAFRLLEKLEQLAVGKLVAAGDGALQKRVGAPIGVGHVAAGLADQDDSGRDVPGV